MAISSNDISILIRCKDEATHVLKEVEKTSKKLGDAFGFVKVGALAGAAGLAAVAGASGLLIKSAIGAAAQMEKYSTQFEVLLGSADAAQARLKELSDFAAKTPFELPEIVQASKLLQTFGGTALATGESLTMVGDMAAASGAQFDEIATWVGRAYTAMASGRPFGEAAQRLQELGLMSGTVRTKLEEMQKTGASGADIWKEFTGSMSGYAGMMDKLSQTFGGLTSTMADSWAALLREFGTPLLGPAKDAVKVLTDFLADPAIISGARALGEAIAGLADKAIAFFSEKTAGAARSVGEALSELAVNLASADVGDFFESLSDPEGALGGLAIALSDLIMAFGQLGISLAQIVAPILPTVTAALVPLMELIAESPTAVSALVAAFIGLKVAMAGLSPQFAAMSAASTMLILNWQGVGAMFEEIGRRMVDALQWAIDQIWKLPFAESILGHKPQLERAATIVADATGMTMKERLDAWRVPIGGAGGDAALAWLQNFSGTMAEGLRQQAAAMSRMISAMTGGPPVGPSEFIGPLQSGAEQAAGVISKVAMALSDASQEMAGLRDQSTRLVPTIDDVSGSLGAGGLGGAAGGAGDAFRGLDADLAALRETMRSTAEAGLGVLNDQILREEDYLASLQGYLDDAQTAHDDLTASINDTTAAMQGWESAALRGTQAFSDASFAISQQQDALQLKINNITLALMDQAEGSNYVSGALSGMAQRLAQSLGMWDQGWRAGHLTVEQVERILAEARDRMSELGIQAQNVNLRENLQLDPLRRELEEMFHPVEEFSFDQIVAGWKGSSKELADYLVLLARNEDYMAKITAAQSVHQAILENLKAAADELSKALDTGIDTVIKSAWEARGDIVVKSIEDAFAAMDRGDKAAAQAALDDANALFARIKALTGGTEAGLFAGIEKVLADTETAINVDVSGMADQVGDDLAKVGVVVQKSTGDILTTLKDSVVFYLETIRNRLDIINDTLVSIPSAQHGGAVLGGGLVAVHPGETIVPVGGRAGGNTIILAPVFNGPVMGDQRQADEFVRRMLPYLKRHVG